MSEYYEVVELVERGQVLVRHGFRILAHAVDEEFCALNHLLMITDKPPAPAGVYLVTFEDDRWWFNPCDGSPCYTVKIG